MKKLITILCLLSTPVIAEEYMSFDECKKHSIENKNVRQVIKDFDKIKHKFKCNGKDWLKLDKIGWDNDIRYKRSGYIRGYHIDKMCINFKEQKYLTTIFNPILDEKCLEKGKKQWEKEHKKSIKAFKRLY